LAGFAFEKVLRWAKLERWRSMSRRPDDHLPFVGSLAEAGNALLLDTSVYIDLMQGRAPKVVRELLTVRVVNHSSIAVTELLHPVGRLDPSHPETPNAIARIGAAIKLMPSHRMFVPDIDVVGRAAILAGILARVQGYSADNRLRALHDCIMFLQALKLGFTVLTRNITDYDFMLQMIPTGRVLLYHQEIRTMLKSEQGTS
jgi:predicted nucleic acid-binding protein